MKNRLLEMIKKFNDLNENEKVIKMDKDKKIYADGYKSGYLRALLDNKIIENEKYNAMIIEAMKNTDKDCESWRVESLSKVYNN